MGELISPLSQTMVTGLHQHPQTIGQSSENIGISSQSLRYICCVHNHMLTGCLLTSAINGEVQPSWRKCHLWQ